jgi:20S proteasome subunit beta 6
LFNAIGSFERCPYAVTGSASALITSLLDNQYEFKTTGLTSQVNQAKKKELSLEETIDLVKDAFTSAGERDIYTGDSVEIAIITKDGIRREMFELKRD